MEEIKTRVRQTPGTIEWNFVELKEQLSQYLHDYRNLAYTDDTIPEAAKDLATLRKMRKEIEDRRKEIKSRCLEPYQMIEDQAGQLTSMIDDTVSEIKKQSDAYELKRMTKKKEVIVDYWKDHAGKIPDEIRHHCLEQVWDARWLNKTFADSRWKAAIDQKIQTVEGDLESIRGMHSEFEPELVAEYYKSLDLQEVLRKKNELEVQKQRILERERQKQEQERIQKEREDQERIRREQEAQNRPVSSTEPNPEMRQPEKAENAAPMASPVSSGRNTGTMVQNAEKAPEKVYECKLLVKGTMSQMQKLSGYANYIHMEVHLVKGSNRVCS